MRIAVVVLFLITCFSAQAQFNYQRDFKNIQQRTLDPKQPLHYNKLIKRFERNDTTLTNSEVLALMIGFTAKPQYKPYQDINEETTIYNLNVQKKYAEALKKANVFLKTHPLSVAGLYEKSYALFKLQYKDSSQYYAYRATRILSAMRFSGNGKTPETAMFALGPADGQDFVRRLAEGEVGTMTTGKDKNGNFLDVLEVRPKDGSEPFKLYFNIQHAHEKMYAGNNVKSGSKTQPAKKGK
jgi:hypothetical protein